MKDGETEKMQATRAIANMIAEYRKECLDAMHDAIIKECDSIVEDGYDPARGQGRGAWWAGGG